MVAKAKLRLEGEDATAAAFKSAVGNAQKTSNKMAGLFKVAFAGVSIGVIGALGKEAIETGDNLNKFAIRAKLAGKEASTLAYAAKQSDVELEALTTSVQKMQIFLSKAESGEKANVQALDAMGIKIQDIKDLEADKQFELIADQVSKLASEEDKARAVTDVFGKAGGNLLPMFEQGAEGIRKTRLEAEKLGLAFNDEQLQKLADADDAIKRLDSSWKGFWMTLTSKVAPGLRTVLDMMSGFDSRGVAEKLDDDIEGLEKTLAGRGGSYGMGGGVGGHYGREAELGAELAMLKARRELLNAPKLTEQGGGRGSASIAVGYGAVTDAEDESKAKTAAEKERAKSEAQRIDAMIAKEEEFRDSLRATREENQALDQYLQESHQEASDAVIESLEEAGVALEELKIEKPWVEGMEIARDTFNTAVDDMVNNGKIQWDELLKFMAVRWLQAGADKLFEQMFNAGPSASGGAGSGLTGFLGKIFGGSSNIVEGEHDRMPGGGLAGILGSVLGGIFGGARDSGGRGSPGMAYAIGTGAQPELFVPDSAGTFIPRGGRNGGSSPTINYNIDARGATMELTKVLPEILKRHSEQIKSDLLGGIRNGRYPLAGSR